MRTTTSSVRSDQSGFVRTRRLYSVPGTLRTPFRAHLLRFYSASACVLHAGRALPAHLQRGRQHRPRAISGVGLDTHRHGVIMARHAARYTDELGIDQRDSFIGLQYIGAEAGELAVAHIALHRLALVQAIVHPVSTSLMRVMATS